MQRIVFLIVGETEWNNDQIKLLLDPRDFSSQNCWVVALNISLAGDKDANRKLVNNFLT